jgi:hypothetical protein
MKKPEVLNRKPTVPSFKTGAMIAAFTFVTLVSVKGVGSDSVSMNFGFENEVTPEDNPIVALYVTPEGSKQSDINRLTLPLYHGNIKTLQFEVSPAAFSFYIKLVFKNHFYVVTKNFLPAVTNLKVDSDQTDMFEYQYRNGRTERQAYAGYGWADSD